MGNRAIITTKKRDLGVYLHWNGGRDSVGAFLEYCELRGFRAPDGDTYGWARLCQVICNYMGAEGLSVGISRYEGDARMDPGANGIYVIEGWRMDWQHLFGRFREGQPRLPELDRRHVAQRRVDPEVVVPVHVVRELGP